MCQIIINHGLRVYEWTGLNESLYIALVSEHL